MSVSKWTKLKQKIEAYRVEVAVAVLEMALVFDLVFGLEFELVPGLEPEWEFDQESLQIPDQELAQEFDQDMELGRCLVGQGPLEYDQVWALRQSHQVGSTVSGTLL